jgi:hypothetical protein
VPRSASWLQPREGCEAFHDLAGAESSRPVRSWWPTIAAPSPLDVQFVQVDSVARPSAVEPVRMSCWFGVSPRPLTTVPFSVSAVSFASLLPLCSSSTLLAISSPLALRHGPAPMRSRASTAAAPPAAWVLR